MTTRMNSTIPGLSNQPGGLKSRPWAGHEIMESDSDAPESIQDRPGIRPFFIPGDGFRGLAIVAQQERSGAAPIFHYSMANGLI
jgi:hypothetical protein